MNGIIEKLKNKLTNLAVFPVTVSKAVYMEDGQTNLEQKLTEQDNKIGNLSGNGIGETSLAEAIKNDRSQLADIVTLSANGTDDTSQIKSIFENAMDGQKIRIKKGTYKLKNTTSIVCSKSVTVEFEEGAIFDVTEATANPAIIFAGSLGTFTLLGANAIKGNVNITLNPSLAVTLTQGDIVYLTTDTAYGGSGELWTAARAYYFKGEMAMVESVNGNIVTLCNPLWDDYTAANTVVCKLNTITLNSKNLSVKGDKTKGLTGVSIRYAKYAVLDKGILKGTSYSCVDFSYCYSFSIRNTIMNDFYKSGLGASYGIAVLSSQNGLIEGNNIQGGRHAVTHGGTTPCRNVRVINNPALFTSKEANTDSIDAHENCEYIEVLHNTCGSITLSGRNNKANRNTIKNNYGVNSALINFEATKTNAYVEATENTLDTYGGNGNDGIKVSSSTLDNITIERIAIKDNQVNVDRTGIQITGTKESTVINELDLDNNRITSGASSVAFATGSSLTNKLSIKNFKMSRGKYKATGNNIFVFSNSPIFTNVEIVGVNKFEVDGAFRVGYFPNVVNYRFNDNTVEGVGNGYSTGFGDLASTGNIEFRRNRFKHLSEGALFLVGSKIFLSDNILEDVIGTPTLNGQVIYNIANTGNYITYGTSAPTTGTWQKGDRCINSSPAVGSPKAWICTVAGTPGTWVSEGNL